jgi:hypothetical protein
MVSADLVAAYPHSMAHHPYATGLRRVTSDTVLDPTVAGIVVGTISVPSDMPFGPVPLRVAPDMITFPTGQVNGAWSWAEAAAAEDLGCEVLVDECYAPLDEADLFSSWWEVVREGRELPGRAATLIKAVSNSLWGLFGMRGDDRESIRWSDASGTKAVHVALPPRRLPHATTAHIAAETAARVRVRMLTEGCYGMAARGHPVHIDTDGLIIRRSAVGDMPRTAAPGEWRVKETMRKVEIRAPQVYRFACTAQCGLTHPLWHYSVAGVPADAAAAIFERVGHHGVSVSFTGTDMVLPAHNAQDVSAREAAVLLARSVGGLLA